MTPPTYSVYWDLPLLIVVVSLVYSATRFDTREAIVHEALRWGGRMALFLGGIGLFLYFLAWWVDSGAPGWVVALVGGGVVLILLGLFLFAAKDSGQPLLQIRRNSLFSEKGANESVRDPSKE